jgi:uncharacterized protein YjbI with pentapeptide repeats
VSDESRRAGVDRDRVPRDDPRRLRRRRGIVLGTLILFVLVLMWLAVSVFPRHVQTLPPLSSPDNNGEITEGAKRLFDERMAHATAQGTVRTTLVQALAALLVLAGAGVAGYFTHQQIKVSREAQLTERFTKAVEQLGEAEKNDLRIGGIHALARLAINSPFDRHAIAKVLEAFVRRRAPVEAAPSGDAGEDSGRPGRQTRVTDRANRDTDSQIEDLPLAIRADDVQAALSVLGSPVFHDVVLSWVDAHVATLPGTSFQGAVFEGAILTGSDLRRANFRDASLLGADLRDAYLEGADLRGADLDGADLRGADLEGADLRKAYLQEAKLQGALLQGAKLHETQLLGADLSGCNLDGAELFGAYVDSRTLWPAGFDPAAHGVTRVGEPPA